MSIIDVAISIEGNLTEALSSIETALGDQSLIEWFEGPVDQHLYTRAVNRFHQQGDDASGHWPELSQYTMEDRVAKGYADGPPEYRTGALMGYITGGGEAHPEGLDVVLQFPGRPPGDGQMELKVAVAQTGAKASRYGGAVPARPVLAISSEDAESILFSLSERLAAFISAGA